MVTTKAFHELAIAFDHVTEEPHFDKTSFRIRKKIFATLDEVNKRATVKLPENDQSVFCQFNAAIFYPANGSWGKQGWTIIELASVQKTMLKDALRIGYKVAA